MQLTHHATAMWQWQQQRGRHLPLKDTVGEAIYKIIPYAQDFIL